MSLSKKIKKYLTERKTQKLIRNYCIGATKKPPGAKFLNCLLLSLALSFAAVWKAATYREVLWNMILVILVITVYIYIANKREYFMLVKECRQSISDKEYRKRLERAADYEVLEALREKISASYAVQDLEKRGDILEGTYEKEKIAVIYHYVGDEESLSTKDILYNLRDCCQQGIRQVRIFTNSEVNQKADPLGERYGIKLKIYDNSKLKTFLKGSKFYPTDTETDAIVKKESEKREKKIAIIKKEILQRNKFKNYLIYSLVLFMMVWYGLGAVYWNIFFGFLLLVMAVSSLLLCPGKKDEEIVF